MHNTPYTTAGENTPFRIDTAAPLEYEVLSNSMSTDVLVIGGGISGLTTAYCLTEAGYKVILVEDGLLGSGESGRTTAHFTYALDDRYAHLEKIFGKDGARTAAESHMAAIDRVEKIVEKEHISCHFTRVPGYLFVHPSDTVETLQKELESAQRLDIPLQRMDQVPDIEVTSPCLKFPEQGQLHILHYLAGLAKAITKNGGQIFTKSRASHVTKEGATVNGHEVTAKHIVVATNNPFYDHNTLTSKQFPYRSYVVGFTIPKKSLPKALWWDSGDHDVPWSKHPYHYVRTEEFSDTHDVLIAGGEDHKTGQADKEHIREEHRYKKLIDWTKKHFPMAKELVYQWSGQVTEPADAMAYIGLLPGEKNIYVITGDSGNGMTHGTIGGLLVSDLIRGKHNKWAELYSPRRSPWRAASSYVQEVANLIMQYGKWLTPGERKTLQGLKNGDGTILRDGLKKVAVYRDDNGKLHTYTAVCPHLGGILVWNDDEKSFDCPVHGSRFDHDGKLIMGPANSDLKKVHGNSLSSK